MSQGLRIVRQQGAHASEPTAVSTNEGRVRHYGGSYRKLPEVGIMSDEMSREILTAEQAAALLQVSTRTVLQLARDAELRGQKVGRAWRFCRSDVLAYVRGERLVDQT